MVAVIIAVTIIVTFTGYLPSQYEAKQYNAKFGTQYSTADFLFSGGVIKELHAQSVPKNPQGINATLKIEK